MKAKEADDNQEKSKWWWRKIALDDASRIQVVWFKVFCFRPCFLAALPVELCVRTFTFTLGKTG